MQGNITEQQVYEGSIRVGWGDNAAGVGAGGKWVAQS